MKNLFAHRKNMRAFTLVETLVAIAIVMVAIVGPFLEIENALTASYVARDQLIGNSLAQEAIEYVRSVRDGNYLVNHANPLAIPQRWWLQGLNGSGAPDCFAHQCTVDPLNAPLVTQCSGACTPLYNNSSSHLYTQQASSGILSRFTRSIQLCYMHGAGVACNTSVSYEARLTVTVSWITQNKPYSTTIVEYLQNWL
jgi:type II secretory pathway pseudopilin PulG